MRGLDQKKGTDIMARPSIVTRSGQQSSISIVREFIYPTEYEPPQIPTNVGNSGGQSTPVTPATPTAFEKKDVGIFLEVLPVADLEKGLVDVTLNPTFSDFDGFVNYGTPINTSVDDALGNPTTSELTKNAILMPVFSIQRLNTQLSVFDGATIAIGGLLSDSIQDVEDRTPVLGDIPLIGRMFSTKTKRPVSTAVIFLVRVELQDPTGRSFRNR
jgi:general secretion pathway protein D